MSATLFLIHGRTEKAPGGVPHDAMEAAYLALCCAEDPCARKLWLLHVLAEKFDVPVLDNPIALARDIVGAAILSTRSKVYRACKQCGRELALEGMACESCVSSFRDRLIAQSEAPGMRIQFAEVPFDGKEGA